MKTVKADLLNPNARKLLKYLADLNRESTGSDFLEVSGKLTSKSEAVPKPDEITLEVATVPKVQPQK